jgi:anti-anti-sigma regulatory factor
VQAVEKEGELVVRVCGEAVLATARALEAGLLRVADRRPPLVTLDAGLLRVAVPRAPLVTLDLSELTFVSSLAMGILVAYRNGVVRSGGRVRLLPNLQPAVREAFARARLMELFVNHDRTAPAGPGARSLAQVQPS